jgi:adenylylsulfate kinase-like enzyme
MVIWVTGLSGSGKTTLCEAIYARLKPVMPHMVRLDGDDIRAAFGDDLSHVEADRARQIKRIQRLSGMLAKQGLVVLVAALYAHPDLLNWNRANLPGYFEVYLKADLDLLQRRDSKGLYRNTSRSEISNVVGVDIPWHAPRQPDLVIDAASAPAADRLALQVIDAIPALAPIVAAKSRAVSS